MLCAVRARHLSLCPCPDLHVAMIYPVPAAPTAHGSHVAAEALPSFPSLGGGNPSERRR